MSTGKSTLRAVKRRPPGVFVVSSTNDHLAEHAGGRRPKAPSSSEICGGSLRFARMSDTAPVSFAPSMEQVIDVPGFPR